MFNAVFCTVTHMIKLNNGSLGLYVKKMFFKFSFDTFMWLTILKTFYEYPGNSSTVAKIAHNCHLFLPQALAKNEQIVSLLGF